LVEKDKSMTAMIQNDREKEWMMPLLDLRNELDVADDRPLRDFRRMNGNVNLFHDRTIPGPYTQEARENWLKKLLGAQKWIRQNGPDDVQNIELISLPELEEIRRLWVVDKHEFEDNLPRIYKEIMGETFPGKAIDDNLPLGADEVSLLQELCGKDRLHFELIRELIDVERQHRSLTRRSGMFEALEQSIRRGFYDDQVDATERAKQKEAAFDAVRQGHIPAILETEAAVEVKVI
jgi:DNA sulfur modification protein DndC